MHQVDNNEGLDYKLKLLDAPSEEEILDRRAREFAAAERDRLAQIGEAEAEISKEVGAEREEVEGDAMHEWWRVRRSELRQHAIELVQQELGGGGDGCADAQEARLCTAVLFRCFELRSSKDMCRRTHLSFGVGTTAVRIRQGCSEEAEPRLRLWHM